MIRCTTCGTDAADGARTCSRCGGPLASAPRADETVAMSAGEMTGPRPGPSPSRITVTSSAEDEGRFLPGTLVAGRYRIIGLLGVGGMGEVYRATDLTLAQSVALKFLPESAAGNERLLERFHNEVRTARQVSHNNVCRVYDIGQADGLPFISMEYVDGEDLASLLTRIGRLPPDKALEISRKLCAGLAAAHERGVIHRDLKPHNIMLNKRGEVVIMDFGLAAIANELHGPEARNGTPAYMSPEQLRGDSVTGRSDIYSLGLIIYELFTGRRAFEAATVAELLQAEESQRPAAISTVVADVDPAVEKVVGRCLNPDPAQRPASALSVAAALPGGDPLAAALAAGETPSPELVAASGKKEGFALRYAVPSLVFVIATLVTCFLVAQHEGMLAQTPMDYSPEVLQQKARDIAATFGYAAKPVDSWATMVRNSEQLDWLAKHRSGRSWGEIFVADSPVDLYYRQSQSYLDAPPFGAVRWNRPAQTEPGMIGVILDSRGRMHEFRAVAPRFGEDPPSPSPDAASVFRMAGLDLGTFHEVTPSYAPSLAFDARRAWTGPYPGIPGLNTTVELATWHGRPVSFFVRWPWTRTGAGQQESARDLAFAAFSALFSATGIIAGAYFARKNLRLGRGDRAGAFRLASATFLLYVVMSAAGIHLIPNFSATGYVFDELCFAVALSFLMWLLYIALEPAVRARWPHSLITWNRLIAGRFGDPRLGSHILMGCVIAMAMLCLFTWRGHWLMAAGVAPEDNVDALLGVRALIERLANRMFFAVLYGSLVFFVLSGLRALVRYDWLAALIASILFALQEDSIRHSTNLAMDAPIYLAVYMAFCYVLLRMGLVPAIVSIFVLNTSGSIPVSTEFGAWYNWEAVFIAALVIGIAAYGFWRSQTTAQVGARGAGG